MISKITLENFFSFGRPTTIELNPSVNILVGINGSGKSNFLKAIKLLYEGIGGEGFRKVFLQDWGGFSSVANFQEAESPYIRLIYEFDVSKINLTNASNGSLLKNNLIYEITIFPTGKTGYYLREKLYKLSESGEESIYLHIENSKGVIAQREVDGKKQALLVQYPHDNDPISFDKSELVLSQISDPDRFHAQFVLKRAIESISVYDYFDTTLRSPIREPRNWSIENKLLPNGENLTILLQQLKNKQPLVYEDIGKQIKDINPYFKELDFDFYANKIFLVLREKKLSQSVSISHISDGTLRYLLLLAIFFNKNRGSLVCLDEPEIGLHPDMIFSLANFLKRAAKESQIIVATHSPLLLNDFNIEDLLIFEKNEDNQTIVLSKDEEDFEEWLDKNFTVGQLWVNGLIGGKRW